MIIVLSLPFIGELGDLHFVFSQDQRHQQRLSAVSLPARSGGVIGLVWPWVCLRRGGSSWVGSASPPEPSPCAGGGTRTADPRGGSGLCARAAPAALQLRWATPVPEGKITLTSSRCTSTPGAVHSWCRGERRRRQGGQEDRQRPGWEPSTDGE